MTVVGGEGDGEDIVGVADEAAGRHARSEFPQPKGLVPGGGEGVGTVGRDNLEGKKKRALARENNTTYGERTKKWAYAVGDDV